MSNSISALGNATPALAVPGGVTGSSAGGLAVGAAPVLLAGAATRGRPGVAAWIQITNGAAAIWLGGVNVSSSNGAQIPASATWSGPLFTGDQLYAAAAAGTLSTVSVVLTGS